MTIRKGVYKELQELVAESDVCVPTRETMRKGPKLVEECYQANLVVRVADVLLDGGDKIVVWEIV